MDQFTKFAAEKLSVLQALDELEGLLGEMQALGIDTAQDAEKVGKAREAIASDALRIALLGAFSDGKTSVVAAWLGRVFGDMKIDMDESSDRVVEYTPAGLPDKCHIVDTPGLFGDKELTEAGRQIMYEEKTRRFISEAHLILYVVDATNPLKETHGDVVRWVLEDLQKLDSTIFVINKMDAVSDLRDEAAFNAQAVIKRDNLKSKLQRAAGLSDAQLNALNIVCVAANPNGRGLPFWFGKPTEYDARSRIPQLKAATMATLSSSVPDVLRAKTGMDVVRDIVAVKIKAVEQQFQALSQGRAQILQEIERVEESIGRGRREVLRHATSLGEELDALDKTLMGKLRPLEMEDLRTYLEDEIGWIGDEVGMKLQRRIKSIVDKYAEQSAEVTNQVVKDVARQIDNTRSFLESMGGKAAGWAGDGLKGLQGMSPEAIKGAIFVARDLLGNMGVVIKFKPWEASKLAGGVAKWAGPVAAALQVGGDVYQHYKQSELEAKLTEAKEKIGTEVRMATQQVRAHLADDPSIFAFLSPQLTEFERVLASLRHELNKIDAGAVAVASLKTRLNALSPR